MPTLRSNRILAVLLAATGAVQAQCVPQWQPGDAIAGVDGVVLASTMWDPDGVGPSPPALVIGGLFHAVGAVPAENLARLDPVSGVWSPIGGGLDGKVSALAVLPNGTLIVGGSFAWAGTTYVNYVASWNGTFWGSLGSNWFTDVSALLVDPSGELYAAGGSQSSGAIVSHFAGNGWNELGRMGSNQWVPSIGALAAMPNGDVVAAGFFTSVGFASISTVARWNGSSWSGLGSGVAGSWFGPHPQVRALVVDPAGDLLVGGNFTSAGGVAAGGIARWNGTTWSAVGAGFSASMGALVVEPGGEIVAGGYTGMGAYNVARWNGSAWTPLGIGVGKLPVVADTVPTVRTFTRLPNGDLFAGGEFRTAGTDAANGLARWDGVAWSGLIDGTNGPMRSLVVVAPDDLVVGGDFTTVAGVAANSIARRVGGVWSPLGVGLGAAVVTRAPSVYALARLSNGDFVAAGDFDSAGGAPAARIARWDGSAWFPLGAGMNGRVQALAVLPGGDLVAGGVFTQAGGIAANGIARWDGTTWSPLGLGVGNSPNVYEPPGVRSLLVRRSGTLVVGGLFSTAGGNAAWYIAQWDGATWSAIGPGMYGPVYFNSSPGVFALAETSTGDLIAGGRFTTAGTTAAEQVARWDGLQWSALGNGIWGVDMYVRGVHAILPLPGGDLLAGGNFANSGAPSHVARWNGVTWSSVGSGLNRPVAGLAWNGTAVLAVGEFVQAGLPYGPSAGPAMASLATLTTPCPASAVEVGSSCIGTSALSVVQPAWIGSNHVVRATGLPALGIAVDVVGWVGTSIPLPSLLPEGVAGCGLWVVPASFGLALPTGGACTLSVALPNTVAIAGQTFLQQVVGVELDASGVILAITSTNALAVTIGAF